MTPTQREAMEAALDAMASVIIDYQTGKSEVKAYSIAHAGLRAALTEPTPVQEPVKVGCLRCNTPKKCDVWGCSPNTFPSEQPAPPADVPMLSTQERLNIITQFTIAGTLGDLIVHVEKLVRQKAGLK